MLRANANALPSRTQAGIGHSVEALPARKDKSIILKKHRALVLLLKAHKQSCSGRAQTLRKGAGEDQKQTQSGSRSGQTRAPCQGADKDHSGQLLWMQLAERTKTARLASPLGIPLGASTGATQRRQTLLPKHTVSTRQTRLRLLWPCHRSVRITLANALLLQFFCQADSLGTPLGPSASVLKDPLPRHHLATARRIATLGSPLGMQHAGG